jgi:hypothetical protein
VRLRLPRSLRRVWIAPAAALGLLGAGVVVNRGAAGGAVAARSPAAAGFAVRYNGLESRHRVRAVFVLPGHSLTLDVASSDAGRVVLRPTGGTAGRAAKGGWRWEAPSSPGLYPLFLVDSAARDSITLNAFVLVPASAQRGEYLNGYRIGRYPERPLRGLAMYQAPLGFVEVTRENHDTPVSPHFRLGEFVAKQEGGYPKYLVLDERLLLKLEHLLERVRADGHPGARFHVMSGYRTPYYNRAIGNVGYSRHVYGAAADIFIDASPRDGIMDDLNGDGRSDLADARLLHALIDRAAAAPGFGPLLGGLAAYRATARHGPFVHVDVRGYRARW